MILQADEYSDVRTVCRHFGEHSVSNVLPKISRAPDSKVLMNFKLKREYFDPSNLYHRAAYYNFRKNGKWASHFYNEYQYNDVVATVTAKMLDYMQSNETHPIFGIAGLNNGA